MNQPAPRRFSPLRWLLALIITTAIAYPTAVGLNTLIDTLRGDAQLLNSWPITPKMTLLDTFLGHWLSSTPYMLMITLLVLLPLSFISYLVFQRQIIPVLFLSLLALNPLLALLYQFDLAAMIVASLWLCVLVCVLNVVGGEFGGFR